MSVFGGGASQFGVSDNGTLIYGAYLGPDPALRASHQVSTTNE